jgi:ferrochelatase
VSGTVGVLMMAYGGPNSLSEVERYLLDVRGFRPTPAALVEEVRRRYERIGGRSPILDHTRAQARALQAALGDGGPSFEVAVGMRHWHPYIGDTMGRWAERSIRRVVGVVMAPHYSRLSVGAYYRAVEGAAQRSGVEVRGIESWHLLPGYVGALADRVRWALAHLPEPERSAAPVIFTAHSLPERILTWDDAYPRQLIETMEAVMAKLGERPHRLAYQSASHTGEPWLGPDAAEVVEEFARGGARHVVVAPVGFLCENVEILYDVDVELQERAQALGVRLQRTEMLHDAADMIADLAGLVRTTAREAGWA